MHVEIGDGELQLHDRLKSSHSAVDDLINHGSAVLEQIRMQGMGLRGVKRKVLEIGNQVGTYFKFYKLLTQIKGNAQETLLFTDENAGICRHSAGARWTDTDVTSNLARLLLHHLGGKAEKKPGTKSIETIIFCAKIFYNTNLNS